MSVTKESTSLDNKPTTDSSVPSISEASHDDKASLSSTVKPSQPPPPAKEAKPASPKWYTKFSLSSRKEKPGKEAWRDASLPDKERWKQWHKAMDKERTKGSTAGFYAGLEKNKGF